jgi:hypothetical protein
MDGWAAVGIGTLIVTVLGGVGALIISLRKNRAELHQEAQKTALDQALLVIGVLQKDVEGLKKESGEKDRDVANCERRYARAVAWIESADDALTRAGIPHRTWKETPEPPPPPAAPVPPGAKP